LSAKYHPGGLPSPVTDFVARLQLSVITEEVVLNTHNEACCSVREYFTWSWSLCKILGSRKEMYCRGEKKSLKLTLTVMGLSHRSLLDGWGMAPSLLLHSLEELLRMAAAPPVPTCNLSGWVKSECIGNILRVICMRHLKTTGLPQREKKLIMGMAVLIRGLTFEASNLKCFPHRAGAAHGDNSLRYLDLQGKY